MVGGNGQRFLGLVCVCDFFFVLYSIILYYIQNYEYRENLFFKIMFRWFKKPQTNFILFFLKKKRIKLEQNFNSKKQPKQVFEK